ncbi:MAG TPA: hypothetical protein VF756_14250 [Thermoanaerobaculia bacterium]
MDQIGRIASRITCLGLLLVSLAAPSQAAVRPVGPELQVNEATVSHQRHPAVAGDSVGTFMVTWTSEAAAGRNVYVRCRSSHGALYPGEIQVNGNPIVQQAGRSAIASLAGYFAAVWEGDDGIRAQRFQCGGQRAGEEIPVSVSTSAEKTPSVDADRMGNFVVVWESHGSGGTSHILARRFDRNGNSLSGPFEVSPSAAGRSPRVDMAPSGAFLVTWEERNAADRAEIWARRFDASGSPLGPGFQASGAASAQRERAVPLLGTDGGGFSVLWEDGGRIVYQRFDAVGQRIGVETQVEAAPEPLTANAAVDPFGNVLLLWEGLEAEGGRGVFGRYFDSSWQPVTPVFHVNTSTGGEQIEPAVAFDSSGDFFAVWSGQDGNGFGVFGQRFDEVVPLHPDTLSLHDGRFQVQVSWNDTRHGETGVGRAIPLSSDSGAFWFFQEHNLELMIKVLDGRTYNGHFWVFYGSLSDVEYEIEVTDTATGATRTYHNPPFQLASHADTHAFPATGAPAAASVPVSRPSTWRVPAGRVGPETQVNIQTPGMQRQPAIASDPQGNFLVVWESEAGVWGRLYDASGNPRGGEIRIHQQAPDYQGAPQVAAGPEGYVVSWYRAAHGGGGIYTRAFDREGQPLGDETLIGSPTFAPNSSLAADGTGGFVLAWGQPPAVFARRLGSRGEPVGNLITVDTGIGLNPVVKASPYGGFWVAWTHAENSNFPTYEQGPIRVRRYSASGEPLGTHTTIPGPAPGPGHYYAPMAAGIVFHENGEVSVAGSRMMSAGTVYFVQRLSATGDLLGPLVQIPLPSTFYTQYASPMRMATGPAGQILLIWSLYDYQQVEEAYLDLYGRLFDNSWQPAGPFFRLNTFRPTVQDEAAATFLPGGDFVAAWGSGEEYPSILPLGNEGTESQDGSYFGVFAQRFRTRCLTGDLPLCLQSSRFEIEVSWRDPRSGATGTGSMVPLTDDTGAFWFFEETNLELMVKVLDGRPTNGHFWVFYGALSDVEYTLRVLDTATGAVKTYHNPPRTLGSRADTRAFLSE